jgi:hypothetical protein
MPLPEALATYTPTPKRFASATVQWFAPITLGDLTALQAQFATAPAGTVKYVCGNTTYGVEKYFNGETFQTPYSVRVCVCVCMCVWLVRTRPYGIGLGLFDNFVSADVTPCRVTRACLASGVQVLIDVTRVPELTAVTATATAVTVGAAVSMSRLIDVCRSQDPLSPVVSNDPSTEAVTTATSSFSALARHLLLVASYQVQCGTAQRFRD